MKQYKNITTNEIVPEEDAEDYVLNVLGLTIEPRGKNGEMTIMQLENIESTIEWFFSGNWVKEEIPLEDGNIFALNKEECELDEHI